ncbi:MAG: hypothetical protein OQL06_06565 [Gammaproteobacteria bacterium]|nr:hypothetical protein [Gammaproteobacteria bacterium]
MSFTPSVIAFTGITLAICARTFQWGADNDIPAANLIALFFAEITMVASGLGIAAYIKSRYKTAKVKLLGLWNLFMLIISGMLGYNIFSTL